MLRVDLLDCHPPILREIEVPMKAVICATGDVRLEAGGPRSVRHLLRKCRSASAGALLERHPSEQKERAVRRREDLFSSAPSLYQGGAIRIDEPAP